MANKTNKTKDKILVIVESPSKAKTINKYLGDDYIISSSMGHIIDLPKSRLAVDVDNGFKPEYITIRGKAKILNELKKLAAKSTTVLLATDPDREGEAISWHLERALSAKCSNIKRIEFNEVTETAIKEAVQKPRFLNMELVNAQQARRILDRIIGYSISPILWKKIKKGLSAGRVQSVALKVICDREDQIDVFLPQEYWTLELLFEVKKKEYIAALHLYKGEKIKPASKEEMDKVLTDLENEKFIINEISKKERKRNPQAPFITSKLQQDAANRLGFTSSKTMMIAQQLYEGINVAGQGPTGLITYMRTDSTRISNLALNGVRDFIKTTYSEDYLPEKPNTYKNKKGAQDAHEAIRPTNVLLTPASIKADLSKDQHKIYNLIWSKFISSQMTPERTEINSMKIKAGEYEFRASASKVLFDGFTIVDKGDRSQKSKFPNIQEGEALEIKEFKPEQHFTSPPPRYNDASLVKFLEESGIGRPSTYAPTINTLIRRYYATRSGRQLVPTVLGKLVNKIMKEHFATLVSIDFTVNMEDNLDNIEETKQDWVEMLERFWIDFKPVIDKAEENIEDMKGILDEPTDLVCEKCGKPMVKKLGKFGFFLACSGFPECYNSKSLPLGQCPKADCDGDVVKRSSKKGRPFYACSNYPDCDFITRDVPLDRECPTCGKALFGKAIRSKGQKVFCLNKECKYTMDILDEVNGSQ